MRLLAASNATAEIVRFDAPLAVISAETVPVASRVEKYSAAADVPQSAISVKPEPGVHVLSFVEDAIAKIGPTADPRSRETDARVVLSGTAPPSSSGA